MRSFDDTPFNRELGFTLVEYGDGRASVAAGVSPWFLQENGVVHGGVLAALADTAGVYALRGDAGFTGALTGVELKINFLEAAYPDRGPLVATARVLRRGRTLGICEAHVKQHEILVATALLTYLFLARRR